jgi:hypothetical protein
MKPYPLLVDFLVAIIFALVWSRPWASSGLTDPQWTHLKESAERGLAATAVQSEAVAAMTIVTIIFVAIGALLGQGQKTEAVARSHLRAAAVLSFVSLAIGVWVIGSIPVQVNFYNVAYDGWLALFSASQIVFTFLAAWRVLGGMWRLLS